MGRISICLLFLAFLTQAQSESLYWISFKNKDTSGYFKQPHTFLSEKSLQRRLRQGIALTTEDFPVNTTYIKKCTENGASVQYSLKWFNGVVVKASPASVEQLKNLDFVTAIRKLGKHAGGVSSVSAIDYGNSLQQNQMLGIDIMHEDGFHGEGVTIAIFDAGFRDADQLALFESHFQENRVLSTWDFVDNEMDVFDDDEHGTYVWSICAGNKTGALVGPAYKANYHLLVTENPLSESQVEELNWAKAAEYADSAGVDIISSSLGYCTFDNASENYVYADMNGDSAIITRAADIAASKGILVVNSVGNEGNTAWYYLLAPADGDSVLAVGAVNSSAQYTAFSSKGPSADGRVKPNVSAQGQSTIFSDFNGQINAGNGTSYSCPLVSGLAAGIWQSSPDLTSMGLLQLIEKSASHYNDPDNYRGYGVPNYNTAKLILGNIEGFRLAPNPGSSDFRLLIPASFQQEELTLELYDSKARKVYYEKGKPGSYQQELQLPALQSGMYHMIISTASNTRHTLKLIIHN